MQVVSLAEAARLTKKSRNTLKSHLKQGKLSGTQNEDGDWEIQVSELIRAYEKLPGVKDKGLSNDGQGDQSRPSTTDDDGLVAENAVLKERLEQSTRRFTDEKHWMQEQIDLLKQQIEKKDSLMLSMNAQIEDHRERRAKTEDRADEIEKRKDAAIAKYRVALSEARERLKDERERYRWRAVLKGLVGKEGNRERVGASKSATQ